MDGYNMNIPNVINKYIYIYVYIYTSTQRERYIYTHMHTCMHACPYVTSRAWCSRLAMLHLSPAVILRADLDQRLDSCQLGLAAAYWRSAQPDKVSYFMVKMNIDTKKPAFYMFFKPPNGSNGMCVIVFLLFFPDSEIQKRRKNHQLRCPKIA